MHHRDPRSISTLKKNLKQLAGQRSVNMFVTFERPQARTLKLEKYPISSFT